MKNSLGMKESDPDLMTPPWGCYWFGQWLANIEFAAEHGMELITVHKKDGQGRGELDRFPTIQDWEGTDGKQFSKDGFLGGSQVRRRVPSALSRRPVAFLPPLPNLGAGPFSLSEKGDRVHRASPEAQDPPQAGY